MGNARQTILVAIREYGLPHEPWMRRQISGMPLLDIGVMCWKRSSIGHHPIPEAAVHTLKSEVAPYDSNKRWVYRLANLSGGNFIYHNASEKIRFRLVIYLDPGVSVTEELDWPR